MNDTPDVPADVPMFNGVPIGDSTEGSSEVEVTEATEAPEVEVEAVEIPEEDSEPADSEQVDETLHKVIINGEEQEVTLDQLIKDYQLAQASHEKFRQAKEYEKDMNMKLMNVNNLLAEAKENPAAFIKDFLGVDPTAWAEDLLIKKLEYESLSPEQRELQRLKHQEQQWKEHQSKQEAAQKQAEQEALQKQYAEEVDVQMAEALTEMGYGEDSPAPKHIVARVAEEMLAALNRGQQLTAKQAAQRVKQDYNESLKQLVETLDPKDLSPEFLKKIRQQQVTEAKQKAKVRPDYVPNRQTEKAPIQENDPMTGDRKWDEHFKKLSREDK